MVVTALCDLEASKHERPQGHNVETGVNYVATVVCVSHTPYSVFPPPYARRRTPYAVLRTPYAVFRIPYPGISDSTVLRSAVAKYKLADNLACFVER